MEEKDKKSRQIFAKLKPRRGQLRRNARKLEEVSVSHAKKFIVDRFDNIKSVRRHALGWLVVVGLLIAVSALQLMGYQKSYSFEAPVAGGVYAEGVVGPLETINPILARSQAELSASRLVFSSLLNYDSTGHLRGELAETWRAENGGKRYIVDLRKGLKWHDGTPVTVEDVMFTVNLMKNPLVRSPLYSSWSQIKIVRLSETSVAFDLSRVYAGFPHALTFGILPRHILSSTAPESLRESDFNREPVGTGPFEFSHMQIIDPDEGRSILYLAAYDHYVRGRPKLDKFQLHVFKETSQIKKALLQQEINAGTDFTSKEVADIVHERPDDIVYRTLMLNGMYAFFNNDSPIFADKTVRKAFLQATDRKAIIKNLGGYASVLEGPLTTNQLPSMATKRQAGFDSKKSAELLDQAGWKADASGKRSKDGKPLTINLVSIKTGDYPVITEQLKKQWEAVGATVVMTLFNPDAFQQTVIVPRNYDVLVYELELGADPDVFAYWHTSQADPRGLNLSNYKSSIASDALASAQLRLELSARLPKYELFANTWLEDTPAIALYQPQLHYVTSPSVKSIQVSTSVVNRTGRYRLVDLWTVESAQRYASP
ncbi:MAG: peptide ABC transporter substrate-binding protein [Candidatus Saccharimonadales bacterium]